jgi:hypothetical protein
MIHIVDLVEHHHCRHRDPLSGPAAGPFSAASASHARRYDFAMLGADTFRPDQWHDFFITVAGAAAVLTGLVFVALSLNLGAVIPDPTHRYRAIGTLSNFAGIFVLCTFAFAGTVYVSGYLRARSKGGSPTTLSVLRTLTGTMLYAALFIGAVVLVFGSTVGLYIAGVAMVLLGVYSVSGAWLLVVAAYESK